MTTSFSRMWSEEEYLALPETKEKIELFDGCLVEQAAPTYGHQDLAVELCAARRPAARAAGLRGTHHVEKAAAKPGQILRLTASVATDIDPATLVPGN